MMRATHESPRMFDNDYLDALTRVPWWIVPLLWLPASLALFAHGVASQGVALGPAIVVFLAGWFFWTFAEYWLHRTLFHWIPDTRWGPRMHFMMHGVHHDWPMDHYRLVMPPTVSIGLFIVHFALFWVVFGPVWMFPFIGGYVFGYTVYDCTHYATHHFKPRGMKWFKRLAAHHMNHHFSGKPRKYGVSTTLWDHAFRTV